MPRHCSGVLAKLASESAGHSLRILARANPSLPALHVNLRQLCAYACAAEGLSEQLSAHIRAIQETILNRIETRTDLDYDHWCGVVFNL